MKLCGHYIGGKWMARGDAVVNINPSETRATWAQPQRAAHTQQRRVDALDAVGNEGRPGAGARFQLQMGNKNALVAFDVVGLEVAASDAVEGVLHSTGQRRAASSRLVVTSPIQDRFVQARSVCAVTLWATHASGLGLTDCWALTFSESAPRRDRRRPSGWA